MIRFDEQSCFYDRYETVTTRFQHFGPQKSLKSKVRLIETHTPSHTYKMNESQPCMVKSVRFRSNSTDKYVFCSVPDGYSDLKRLLAVILLVLNVVSRSRIQVLTQGSPRKTVDLSVVGSSETVSLINGDRRET